MKKTPGWTELQIMILNAENDEDLDNAQWVAESALSMAGYKYITMRRSSDEVQ